MDAELAELVKVVASGHEEWDERRSRWNHFSERDAAVRIIAVPANKEDVVKIVDWARKYNQTSIGARAGGHGFFSSAQVVVDLRDGFNYASVEQDEGIATIGMGQTLKDLDERTDPYHVPMGVVSHTGCGLLVTGGVGYLCKSRGTSADNIVEVTVVTSDGEVHTCSEINEPDLFFAVRGAAPNIGIVTEIKARCIKCPDALCALRAWPNTEENVKRLFDWADQDAVLNDTTMTVYIGMIPSPDYSAHLCVVHIVCVGPTEEDTKYKELIGQLEGTPGDIPLLETSRVPFSVPQTIFDASFPSQFWYVTQTYYPGDKQVPASSLEAAVEAYNEVPLNPTHPIVIFEQRGNDKAKFHQVPSDSCAQPRFGQRWECYIFFGTADAENADTARDQGRSIREVILKGGAQAGGRCHFTKDEPSKIEFFYGPNSERLRKVVAKYDPHHLFAKCNGMEF